MDAGHKLAPMAGDAQAVPSNAFLAEFEATLRTGERRDQ